MRRPHHVSPRVAQSLLMCGALLLSAGAFSAETIGRGFVSMSGSILETPCDIAVGDRDQALIMDVTPIVDLARQGVGPEKAFSIRLVNCVLPRQEADASAWQRFVVTFDGMRERDAFGVSGSARGVALKIRDARGTVAMPGMPMPGQGLTTSHAQLDYRVAVVANQQPLRSGDYRSAIRFTMNYY